MRSLISRMTSGAMLFLTISSSSCATLQQDLPPKLELRTLRLSTKVPGFEYQYEVCTKYFLGVCTRHNIQVDYYDLSDPKVRDQLINMGFVAMVRQKPTP